MVKHRRTELQKYFDHIMNKASILNDVAFGIEVTNKMRSKLIHRAKKLSGRVCYLCNIHSGAIVGLRLNLASDLFQGIFFQLN